MPPTTAPSVPFAPRHLTAVADPAPGPGVRPAVTFYWLGRCPDQDVDSGHIGITRTGRPGEFVSSALIPCVFGCGAAHLMSQVPEDDWMTVMGPDLDAEIAEVMSPDE